MAHGVPQIRSTLLSVGFSLPIFWHWHHFVKGVKRGWEEHGVTFGAGCQARCPLWHAGAFGMLIWRPVELEFNVWKTLNSAVMCETVFAKCSRH